MEDHTALSVSESLHHPTSFDTLTRRTHHLFVHLAMSLRHSVHLPYHSYKSTQRSMIAPQPEASSSRKTDNGSDLPVIPEEVIDVFAPLSDVNGEAGSLPARNDAQTSSAGGTWSSSAQHDLTSPFPGSFIKAKADAANLIDQALNALPIIEAALKNAHFFALSRISLDHSQSPKTRLSELRLGTMYNKADEAPSSPIEDKAKAKELLALQLSANTSSTGMIDPQRITDLALQLIDGASAARVAAELLEEAARAA